MLRFYYMEKFDNLKLQTGDCFQQTLKHILINAHSRGCTLQKHLRTRKHRNLKSLIGGK
jgi:hypothetical protein